MTKVLHIVWSYGNGGMENIVRSLIDSDNKNFNNHLCIINDDIDSKSINDKLLFLVLILIITFLQLNQFDISNQKTYRL